MRFVLKQGAFFEVGQRSEEIAHGSPHQGDNQEGSCG